ncbi:LETM1 domain-containing protein 1-like [Pollicipes pollicipes]|uniref:LETM1 domain-containing protein 1-like n=1 Tax=Pollicipes pollicipes TaxID=41117 RepID=UPI001884BF24|nr:LETM1 domain-containing protein 1-like [Pollicipes pollicipes]
MRKLEPRHRHVLLDVALDDLHHSEFNVFGYVAPLTNGTSARYRRRIAEAANRRVALLLHPEQNGLTLTEAGPACNVSDGQALDFDYVPCVQLGRGLGESEGRRPVTRVQKYVFGRYMQYLHKFQQVLESEFPAAFRLYRVFTVGVRDFVRDAKSFALLARKVHSTGLGSLSRRELELYFRTPRDMRAVAPVLLVSALPLAQNVVFPLAYLFPRQLLSRHFWSLQQRAEFALHEHKRRLLYMRPVLRHLQASWYP